MTVIVKILCAIGIGLASVLGLALVLITLVLLTRVDFAARYSEDGLYAAVGAWGFRFTLYPRPAKEQKSKKREKKPRPKPEEPAKEKRGGEISQYLDYVRPCLDALKGALRTIIVKRLRLRFTAASADDPAAAALEYGAAWSVAGTVSPMLEASKNVRKYSFDIDIDYDAPHPLLYFDVLLRSAVWRFVIIGIRLLIKIQKIKKERNQYESNSSYKNRQ